MVERIWRSWFFRAAFFGTLGFALATAFIPTEPLLIGLRVALITTAIAVFIGYSRDLVPAMLARNPDAYERVLMGILGSAVAYMLSSLIPYLWRIGGKPAWWINSDYTAYPIWLAIQALGMHLWAKGALKRDVPSPHRIGFGVLMAVTAAGFLSLAWREADVAAFIAWTRPWLDSTRP